MMAPIDPSPVPSFRGVAPTGRAEHLAKRRKGVESAVKGAMLVALTDAILEASVPEPERARRCLAVDWTDHETWGRPKDKQSGQISADPDAAWGHAKRNAPGAKDGLFFGYYAQVAVLAPEEGSKGDPEFIWRVVLKSASVEPADEMAGLLERMAGTGAGPSDVLADCGYSFKTGFAAPTSKDRGRACHGPAPVRPRAEGHLRRSRLCERESLLPGGAGPPLVARTTRTGRRSSRRA